MCYTNAVPLVVDSVTAVSSAVSPPPRPALMRVRSLEALDRTVAGLSGGQPRSQQTEMCEAVAGVFANRAGGCLVVCAGTGTGKTLAYLVPAVVARRQVVVATATKALQDQILDHDVPKVADGVGRTVTAVTLKGRSNYLCAQKVKDLREDINQGTLDGFGEFNSSSGLPEDTARLMGWEKDTINGDYAELTFEPSAAAWAAVSSTSEECPGQQNCPSGDTCFYEKQRKAAEKADVVIVNHHLYLHLVSRNAALVNSGVGPFGSFRRPVIIDEAHEFADTATDVLGKSLSQQRYLNVAKRLKDIKGFNDTQVDSDSVLNVEETGNSLFDLFAEYSGELLPKPLPYNLRFAAAAAIIALMKADKNLETMLETAINEHLKREEKTEDILGMSDMSHMPQTSNTATNNETDPENIIAINLNTNSTNQPEPQTVTDHNKAPNKQPDRTADDVLETKIRAIERLETSLLALIKDLTDMSRTEPDTASWIETVKERGNVTKVVWRTAPLKIDEILDEHIWRDRISILTSATIPPGYARRVGIETEDQIVEAGSINVGSPFQYSNHLLYCPKHIARPGQPGYDDAAHKEMVTLIEAAEGRTLALFTSWAALDKAAEHLRDHLQYPILTQRDYPKPELINRFTEDPHTCLLGTLGLWQGIDVPGESCQLVIIARLPFPHPNDPLLKARRETATSNAFREIDVPATATRLAQGVGRLIRTETDQGAVAVLDSRLATAQYRKLLLDTIPPFKRTINQNDIITHLKQLRNNNNRLS